MGSGEVHVIRSAPGEAFCQGSSPLNQVTTSRLVLRLMSPEFLEASLRDDALEAESILGSSVPGDWLERKLLMSMRLNDCRSDPAYGPWSLRAIIRSDDRKMVGHIGFHSRPGAQELKQYTGNGVELGYTVFSTYRRNGYAREAIQGLLRWAKEEHLVQDFVISVAPDNVPSKALASTLGFVKVGARLDEVDGFEDVHLLPRESLARFLEGA